MTRDWPITKLVEVGLDLGGSERKLGRVAIADNITYFAYDERFQAVGIEPSPIKMKVGPGLRPGTPELDGLPGLLHDSLPDGWARLVLDRYLVTQGYAPQQLGALDRLALVSRQGMGALTYYGGQQLPLKAPSMDFDTAAALIANAPTETNADMVHIALTLTGSAGGMRPKAYVYMKDGEFTFDGETGTPWIMKFPAKTDGIDIGAVEYAYSLMARAAGIDMPPTTLKSSNNGPGFFAVERFDRTPDGQRLHMASLGGLLNAPIGNTSLTYTGLMRVAGDLTKPTGGDVAGIEEQIRRMAFNVLARNRDDHVKNHAFLMDGAGRWRNAPAFDLTYADLPEHRMVVGTEGREPGPDDMRAAARPVGISDERTDQLVDQVRDATRQWERHAREAGVGPETIRIIERAINDRDAPPSRNVHRAPQMRWQGSGISD